MAHSKHVPISDSKQPINSVPKSHNLKIGSWNIKRGLVTKEIELKDMLIKEDFDIMFLNETDTKQILSNKDYQINGFDTIRPKISATNGLVRLICLVRTSLMEAVKICDEIMTDTFPSIWLEINLAGMKKTVIGGYYREWNNNGLDSIPEQVKRMNILTTQIDKAAGISSRIIMLGDMNLCSRKWNQDKFKDKRVAEILRSSLEENGLVCRYLGDTFSSDIVQKNGNITTSALDHVYLTEHLDNITVTDKLDGSSSDHLPIFAKINHSCKKAPKMKTVTRRCTKFLTKESWCNNLITKNWEELGKTENIDEMAEIITSLVSESLDECAPVKTLKIRNQNKHGISEKTRKLIKERDESRKAIHKIICIYKSNLS